MSHMDIDIYLRCVVVRIATPLLAAVGFLLSVFAVVLTPLLPIPIEVSGGLTREAAQIRSPLLHNPRRPPQRVSVLSHLEGSITSRKTSDTSSSSQSGVAASLPARPSSAESTRRVQELRAPPSMARPPSQRLVSLPITTTPDYFSSEPWKEEGTRKARAETAPVPVPVSSTSSDSPPVQPPVLPAPAESISVVATEPTPKPPPAPPVPSTSFVIPPPLPRPATTASCERRESPSTSPPPSTNAFRIPHLKRSWTNHQKNAAARTVTCPDNIALFKAEKHEQALRRPTSSSGIKSACPLRNSKEEKTLRKTSSTPDGGLVSKWKVHRHRKQASVTMIDSLQEKPATVPTSPPASPPRPRTQPYQAPYYFPSPGSPEAVDYIRRVREDQIMPRAVTTPLPPPVAQSNSINNK